MSDEHRILKDLVINENEIIDNLVSTIQKIKDFFRIEDKSGKIIFQNYSKLTNPQKICCVLMGKYFANRLSIIEDHTASVSELSSELDIPVTTLSAPLKSLRKSNWVLYAESRYKINIHQIDEIVDSLLKNVKSISSNKHKEKKQV